VNINMLRDTDDDPGFYAAARGTTSSWGGAGLYESRDGGTSYTKIAEFTRAATMGYTTDVLGDFSGGNIVDEINSVNVVLRGTGASLMSTTYAGLLSGVNACVIGREILFFRDATLQGDGSYTLRGLLRGRRGSEFAMSEHESGDRLVLANTALIRVAQVTADIGATRLYKGVTSGTLVSSAVAQEFTNEGAGLKPYAPVHLGGGRDASNNLTINWTRRNRISGEWRDSVDVPMSEASEEYVVRIFSSSSYATVLRTVTGLTSPTCPYSAADQTSDGLTPGNTVYFDVRQVSAVVGAGYAARGSV